LREWGLTPEYINEYWTEELLVLMFISRARSIKRQRALIDGKTEDFVSDDELFRQMGIKQEVVGR